MNKRAFELRDNNCGNCYFWANYHQSMKGECRRRSPRTFRSQLPMHAEKELFLGTWPETEMEDWCGEWGKRPPEAGEGT